MLPMIGMFVHGQANCQRTASANNPPTKNHKQRGEQKLNADDLVIVEKTYVLRKLAACARARRRESSRVRANQRVMRAHSETPLRTGCRRLSWRSVRVAISVPAMRFDMSSRDSTVSRPFIL